jgi:hypothetical protein
VTATFVKNPPSNSFTVRSVVVSARGVITIHVRVPGTGQPRAIRTACGR